MASRLPRTGLRVHSRFFCFRFPRSCLYKALVRFYTSRFMSGDMKDLNGVETKEESISSFYLDAQETKLMESKWKRRFLYTQYRCDAIFVLGPMGAGKTTVINDEFKTHSVFRNYAYVDTDEIMGMLKGFESNKVEEYYPVARNIAIHLTDWILEQKISFVAEGTCVKYLELIDYMNRLKSVGYHVRVKRLPRVPLDTVLERAKRRKNRLIPDHVVESILEGSNLGIEKLYQSNKIESLFEDMDEQERNEELRPAASLEIPSPTA
ncbi:uncharacterized protein LOC111330122 [Stylophora pistillata]|uniref:uncharacterized protein LOC111330122 n=1 Tax=Stylophora pistillata TaxID=50429 RepID=UPI000C04F4A1|nr:uncharacterized protein LOC111330122 [Stylophora pistillata]